MQQQLMEAVAAGVAHEVRNPLNAVQINLRILEQELGELIPDRTAHVYAILEKIAHELVSLDNFVADFLRFARPARLKLEPVSMRPLLSGLGTFIGPECAKKGVELRLDLEEGPAMIRADALQLKHAVLNLVLNGLQATDTGGTITIATGWEGAKLKLEVRDTGEGIAPDVMEQVFEVFFTRREGGTGLGLPIARRIIEEHDGTVTLMSRAGAGTVARILLPAT